VVKMPDLYHDHSYTADGGTQEILLSEKSLVADGSPGSRAAESAKRPRASSVLRTKAENDNSRPLEGKASAQAAPAFGGRLASIDSVPSSPRVPGS
jgi:hypothetical protein